MIQAHIRRCSAPCAREKASRTRCEPCLDGDEATCRVRHVMLEVRAAIADVPDGHSLASMRDMLTAGVADAGAALAPPFTKDTA